MELLPLSLTHFHKPLRRPAPEAAGQKAQKNYLYRFMHFSIIPEKVNILS